MTYSSELKNESSSSFFVKLYFRNNRTGSVATVGSLRDITFTYGDVVNVYSLSSGSSIQLTAETTKAGVGSGEYYFDETAGIVSVHSANYTTRTDIVIEYVLYISTKDMYAPRNLTSWSGGDVFWNDYISSIGPIPTSDASSIDGFIPSISGNINVNNNSHYFDFHIGTSAYANGTIEIYHGLTENIEGNVSLIFSGNIESINISNKDLSINYFSVIKQLDGSFSFNRSPSVSNNFKTTNYSLLDPSFAGEIMRVVYGKLDSVRAVGIEFDADTKTSYTDVKNHNYAICKHYGSLNASDITCTITNIVSSSTVTELSVNERITYEVDVDDATGINQFDNVFKSPFDNTDDTGWIVRSVSGNRIIIDMLKNTATVKTETWSVGNVLRRTRIFSLRLANKNKNDSIEVHMDRPPSLNATTKMLEIYVLTEKYVGSPFVVKALEQFCEPNDYFDDPANLIFYCGVYGEKETATISASTFSTKHSDFGVTSKWYEILYNYLRNEVGISESLIDTDNLIAIRDGDSGGEISIGFSVPEHQKGGTVPTHREVIGKIMRSVIGVAGVKLGGKLYFDRVRTLTGFDYTINEEDIIEGSFNYSVQTENLTTDVSLLTDYQDLREELLGIDPRYTNVVASDAKILSLNKIKKINYEESDVVSENNVTARTRKLYFDGYPKFYITISLGLDFYGVKIGQTVRIIRSSLPGFDYNNSTKNVKSYRVIKVERFSNMVTLTLLDSQGVTLNGGSF